MLSEVTVSFVGHTFTFPSLYLVSGCLVAFLVFGLVISWATARRIKQKAAEATEVFAIQLERIGNALDRIVIQNAARADNEPARRPENPLPDRGGVGAIPRGVGMGAISPEVVDQMFPSERTHATPARQPEENSAEEAPVDTAPRAPARHVAYSIFGR